MPLQPRQPLDRRLMPRPLPAHLASAMLLWLSSRAALTTSPSGWLRSKPGAESLQDLAGDIERLGVEAVGAALDRVVRERADRFAAGVGAYRRHPFRRAEPEADPVWETGGIRLLDYGRNSRGAVVLVVPSLINRYYVLDLLPGRSFLDHLAAAGVRPLVIDWGEPGPVERGFDLTGYITGPLETALAAAQQLAGGGPVGLLGYCMGGLLALALALRCPAAVACLGLLATPWDFHAEREAQARLLARMAELLAVGVSDNEPVPVAVIQSLFVALDPFLAERKFVRFADLDPASPEARDFVALEDWINDGVPLTRPVALECARDWYRENAPARGLWEVAGRPVRPAEVTCPGLIVVPGHDRIVPPPSAAALIKALGRAPDVLRPALGHIGMMASTQAPDAVWQPIADWLRGQLG